MRVPFFILVSLLIFPTCVLAQASKDDVKKRFLEYSDHISNGDYQGAMDYTIDELFNIVPKADVVSMMENSLHSPGTETKIGTPDITNVYNPFQESGSFYCILEYTTNTQIRLYKSGSDSIRPENPKVTENMKKAFGKDGVSYNAQTGFYLITASKRVIAKANDGKTWKFLVADERQQPLLEKVLPASITNKLFGTKITPGH